MIALDQQARPQAQVGRRAGTGSVIDTRLHGWVDAADWVEPLERSLAAVSASALTGRVHDLYRRSVRPADAFVLVVVDVASADPGDREATAGVRTATMTRLRLHFPFVEAVAAVGADRYAVLARRHPGLAGTVSSLEDALRADRSGPGAATAVWCEELPDSAAEVETLVRGVRIKPRVLHQPDRGLLAAGPPLETLSGAGEPAPTTARQPGGVARWCGRSAAAGVAAAVFLTGAGTAAAVGARHQPWARPAERAEVAGVSVEAGGSSERFADPGGLLGLFLPGGDDALETLLVLLIERDADASSGGAGPSAVPDPASGVPGAPPVAVPEAPAVAPPVQAPAGPAAPDVPAVPEAPSTSPPTTPTAPETPVLPTVPDPGTPAPTVPVADPEEPKRLLPVPLLPLPGLPLLGG